MAQKPHEEPHARTFYATDDVLVTDMWLVVGRRRLLIRELRNLQVAQSRASRTPAVLGVTAAAVPLLAAVTGVQTASAWVAVTFGTGLVLAVAVWLRATEARHLVLHADYGDVHGPVFWSRDPRVFGQVTRAVLRARESLRDQKSGDIPTDFTGAERPSGDRVA